MSHHRPMPKESIPLHLPLPEVHERDLTDWRELRPGHLIRLPDEQQLIVAHVQQDGGARGRTAGLPFLGNLYPR